MRDRQRDALLELIEPLFPLQLELSRQLEQGPGNTAGLKWVNGVRDIRAADTWIFDPDEHAGTLDWELARQLAQTFERMWAGTPHTRIYDSTVLGKVEEVRKHARAIGFLSVDVRISATALMDATGDLLALIRDEQGRR
jgi:hypothetical protein